MWFSASVFWLAMVAFAPAQDMPELRRASEELSHTRALVEAGALPRARLQQAEQAMADAEDEAILRRTLYGTLAVEDLTEQQGEEMTAAATRLFERRKAKLGHAKKLVEEGALPRLALTEYIQEVDRSRRTLNLAQSRATLLAQLGEIARAEQDALASADGEQAGYHFSPTAERYDGDGFLRSGDLKTIELAFETQFSKPLPISAQGATAIHRRLGFDHRGRTDVALDPDQPEGVWLRRFLETLRIPYYAFRSSVPGKATGPHIHIGPPSERIVRGG